MEAEERHHATVLAPLETEPIHVYRKSILDPRLAIPNIVLERCYQQVSQPAKNQLLCVGKGEKLG